MNKVNRDKTRGRMVVYTNPHDVCSLTLAVVVEKHVVGILCLENFYRSILNGIFSTLLALRFLLDVDAAPINYPQAVP
ncbi:hypothetical protein D3C85_1614240 [compost metagenome]